MADNNKKVNIEFSDNGSLQRLKQVYSQAFLPPGSSSLYQSAQGQFGNPALAQQQRLYFGAQGAVPAQNLQMQQSIEAAKNTFAEITSAFKRLDSIQSKYQSDYTRYTERKANLSSQYFTDNPEAKRREQEKLRSELSRLDGIEGSLVGEESRILSGSGYRKRSTFESGSVREIQKAEKEYQKLVQQQEKTNSILTAWQTQDRKSTAEQVKAIEKNVSATQEEKAAAKIYREAQEPERIQRRQSLNQAGGALGYAVINTVAGLYKNQSDFDRNIRLQTNPIDALGMYGQKEASNTKIISGGLGGAVGGVAGALLGGPFGAALGSFLGDKIGEAIGTGLSNADLLKNEQAVRTYKARDDFYQTNNRYKALTGSDAGDIGGARVALQGYGFSMKEMIENETAMARAGGSSRNAFRNSSLSLQYERGWGIDRGISSDIANQARSNRSSDRDIQNIISGVFEKGKDIFKGDRTFLGEFLQTKFLPLQKELLRNQTSVGTGTTMDVLNRFNSVGGQFDSMHQNSSGLISQINSALINPSSDATNAISFAALRNANPGMGMFDTLKERQKGLSSPTYLKAMMEMITQMGGSEEIQKMNLAGGLGLENNLDAVETLYKNRSKITKGTISQSELRSMTSARGDAEANTTDFQKVQAQQSNLIIESFDKAGKLMVDYLTKIVEITKEGYENPQVVIGIDGRIINDAIKIYSGSGAPQNKTKKPSSTILPNPLFQGNIVAP